MFLYENNFSRLLDVAMLNFNSAPRSFCSVRNTFKRILESTMRIIRGCAATVL